MSDYLGEVLAREEHRQGKPIGGDADYCDACAMEAQARLRAECEHDGEQADITEFGKATRTLLCQRCGLVQEVPR